MTVQLVQAEDVASEIEVWLLTQVQLEMPLRWLPGAGGCFLVRDVGELADRLTALTSSGEWGVLKRSPGQQPWAQSMRVPGGWVVEVDGGDGPEAFARRVRRAGSSPGAGFAPLRCTNAEGRYGTSYFPGEVFASAGEAARILWTWMGGSLVGGHELRDLEEGVD